jgi:hypothetical protein
MIKITIKEDKKDFIERHVGKHSKKISTFKESSKMKSVCDRHLENINKKERKQRALNTISQDDACRYHLVMYTDGHYGYMKDTNILEMPTKIVSSVYVKCNSEVLGHFLFPMSIQEFCRLSRIIAKGNIENYSGYQINSINGMSEELEYSEVIKSISHLLTIYVECETFNYISSEVKNIDEYDKSYLSICIDKVNKIIGGRISKTFMDIEHYIYERFDIIENRFKAILLDRKSGKWKAVKKWDDVKGLAMMYVDYLGIYVLCNGDKLNDLSILDKKGSMFFDSKLEFRTFEDYCGLIEDEYVSNLLMEAYNESTILRLGFFNKIKDAKSKLFILFISPMIHEYYDKVLSENIDDLNGYLHDILGEHIELDDLANMDDIDAIQDMFTQSTNIILNKKNRNGNYKECRDLRDMIMIPVESQNISKDDDVKLGIKDLAKMRVTYSNGQIKFQKKLRAVMIDDEIRIY